MISALTPGSRMSSSGTTTSTSSSFERPASTSSIGRLPETNFPISSIGRWVAERPIRWNGLPVSRSSRSIVSARWAPRLVPATACTSSRISVLTPVSVSRAFEVSIRKSDSGVVISRSGGCRSIACRSFCGVSPVRTATLTSACNPASGPRRFRSMS